jgi:outer membrane protein, protease secretion system
VAVLTLSSFAKACGWALAVMAACGTCRPAAAQATTPPTPFGFAQAFDAALAYDPQFRAARHERDSTQGGVPIARAQLLPSVNLSVNDARTKGVRELANSLNQQISVNVDYGSPQASLQMRAPLFNWEAMQRYRQALQQSDAADAVFRARGSELVDRLGAAYMQGLLAAENVRQLSAQIEALEAQRQRADQRLQRGEGSRIEVSDVLSQIATARVRLSDASDQVVVSRRALARLTGAEVTNPRDVPANFEAPPLVPAALDEWLDLARTRNAVLQVRERQVEVARLGIERSKAGHYPRLDAVASLSQSSNESISNLNQSSRLASVGLQLSIPIFSGFGVEASISQARSELAKTEADLANERENVALEVQRQHLAASAGRSRMQALGQAVAAAEVLVEGVTRGQAAGLRTTSEVQDAIARVFSARRDLAQARLDYLLARMRLMLQSGAPLAEVVFDIERLLGGQP